MTVVSIRAVAHVAVLVMMGVAGESAWAAPDSPDEWVMPTSGAFWSHAGIDLGKTLYHSTCQFTTRPCDNDPIGGGVFVGGRFNKTFGLEVEYLSLGSVQTAGGGTAGGKTSASGVNLSLTASLPIGGASSLTGRVGKIYGRTVVGGSAPGLITGARSGWSHSLGMGYRYALSPDWTLRVDADRYRFRFTDGQRGSVLSYTVGLQRNF